MENSIVAERSSRVVQAIQMTNDASGYFKRMWIEKGLKLK